MSYITYLPPASIPKLVIAPFGAVSLVLFLIFVWNKVIEDLGDGGHSWFAILSSVAILVVVGAGMCYLIAKLGGRLALDKAVFFNSMLLGAIIFMFLRIRNIWTMAMITGIAEGVIFYSVFFSNL